MTASYFSFICWNFCGFRDKLPWTMMSFFCLLWYSYRSPRPVRRSGVSFTPVCCAFVRVSSDRLNNAPLVVFSHRRKARKRAILKLQPHPGTETCRSTRVTLASPSTHHLTHTQCSHKLHATPAAATTTTTNVGETSGN